MPTFRTSKNDGALMSYQSARQASQLPSFPPVTSGRRTFACERVCCLLLEPFLAFRKALVLASHIVSARNVSAWPRKQYLSYCHDGSMEEKRSGTMKETKSCSFVAGLWRMEIDKQKKCVCSILDHQLLWPLLRTSAQLSDCPGTAAHSNRRFQMHESLHCIWFRSIRQARCTAPYGSLSAFWSSRLIALSSLAPKNDISLRSARNFLSFLKHDDL